MKKLKLDLDELSVEAFDTAAIAPARGTVRGNQQFTYYCDTQECTGANGTSCNWSQCNTCYTCPPLSADPAQCL